MKRITLTALLLTIIIFSACHKKNEGEITITTGIVSDITENTAKVRGEVSFTGGFTIYECGVCFSERSQPTVKDFYTEDGYGAGTFISTLSNLNSGTKYYVRAYARTSSGIQYGDQKSFTTLKGNGGGDSNGLPSVTTHSATGISSTYATCGGNVTDNGGIPVTERGVCWSTGLNPITSDNHLEASLNGSSGTGSFTVMISELSPGTTYHVRAYAKNSNGTSYGNDVSFTTNSGAPTVTTSAPTNITYTSVEVGGNVTADGGVPVTERGICWGTEQNPTITSTTDHHMAASSSGIGNFTINITGLVPGMTYHVRAYAKNWKGTSYGNNESFTTTTPPPPTGAINGVFSVSPSLRVFFSRGNLQHKASSNQWHFASHQYDICSYHNESMSSSNSLWVDLFGWGTSGFNHGAVCYQPWSTSTTNSDYYAYGESSYNLYEQSGNADWGRNRISNGGSTAWRTLTEQEWHYLFNERRTQSGVLYAKAMIREVVNGVQKIRQYGTILLPDNWNVSSYTLNNVNDANANFDCNEITPSQWVELENAGAVFLPCAGARSGNYWNFFDLYPYGYYWSSSQFNGDKSYYMNIKDIDINTHNRFMGFSVRLVCPVE